MASSSPSKARGLSRGWFENYACPPQITMEAHREPDLEDTWHLRSPSHLREFGGVRHVWASCNPVEPIAQYRFTEPPHIKPSEELFRLYCAACVNLAFRRLRSLSHKSFNSHGIHGSILCFVPA